MGAWGGLPPGLLNAEAVAITPYSAASLGGIGVSLGGLGGAAWPVAGKALFVPFRVGREQLVTRLAWSNGSSVSGNADCGIYDEHGNRLTSTGSTAQAGTSANQVVTLGTPLLLARGLYYLALALDNATGLIQRATPTAIILAVCGVAEMASAFPLPATATLTTVAAAYLPSFGLFVRPSP